MRNEQYKYVEITIEFDKNNIIVLKNKHLN